MVITVDFSRLFQLIYANPLYFPWYVFLHGGWIILAYGFVAIFFQLWLKIRRKKWLATIEYSLLAIDIPKDNEQSMLATEQIFATLSGMKGGANLYEKYWLGKTQVCFSLEIISIEGYIQFLLRTPVAFRDLAEAAIYAQYPDAEITEVEDYTKIIPNNVQEMGENFQLWGTEFTLNKFSAYPLKTYKLFEHSLSQAFIDPMSALLEVMSKLGPGEQLGMQIVIAPVGDDWKKRGASLVKKLIGENSPGEKNISDKLIDQSTGAIEKFSEGVYKLWGDIKKKDPKDAAKNSYTFLTSNEKFVVEMIENKLAKICFSASMRLYYYAHKDSYKRGRGVNAVIGALNQFNSSDLNAIKKYDRLTTDRDYFFVKQRIAKVHKKLIKLFKLRSREGSPEFYLSTEELATLYHFPTITVKAPLLQKIESKKGEPPIALPLAQGNTTDFFQTKAEEIVEPDVMPYGAEETIDSKGKKYVIAESLKDYDFDNNYFEEMFGKTLAKKAEIKKKTPAMTSVKDEEMEVPPNLPFV